MVLFAPAGSLKSNELTIQRYTMIRHSASHDPTPSSRECEVRLTVAVSG
jgi:hypothetical protein